MNEMDVAVAAIVLFALVVITGILASQWRIARVAAYNARLKQLMIERGMTAEEVERILAAKGDLETNAKKGCKRRNDSL